MNHTITFLATLLLAPLAAWNADSPQKETGLGYAVASQLEELLGEPSFVPMQQLWEKRGGWGGVLTAKDGTVVSFNLRWLLNGRNLNDLLAKPTAESASTK